MSNEAFTILTLAAVGDGDVLCTSSLAGGRSITIGMRTVARETDIGHRAFQRWIAAIEGLEKDGYFERDGSELYRVTERGYTKADELVEKGTEG